MLKKLDIINTLASYTNNSTENQDTNALVFIKGFTVEELLGTVIPKVIQYYHDCLTHAESKEEEKELGRLFNSFVIGNHETFDSIFYKNYLMHLPWYDGEEEEEEEGSFTLVTTVVKPKYNELTKMPKQIPVETIGKSKYNLIRTIVNKWFMKETFNPTNFTLGNLYLFSIDDVVVTLKFCEPTDTEWLATKESFIPADAISQEFWESIVVFLKNTTIPSQLRLDVNTNMMYFVLGQNPTSLTIYYVENKGAEAIPLAMTTPERNDYAIGSVEFKKAIIECGLQGIPFRDIANKFHVSIGYIYSILDQVYDRPESKVAQRVAHILEDEQSLQALLVDYSDNYLTNQQIFDKYNLYKNGLYYILDKYNVPRRNKSKRE